MRVLGETWIVNVYGSMFAKAKVQRANNIIGESVDEVSVDYHVKSLVYEK